MTTGKPQQTAAPSNPQDDLIAELSRLMEMGSQPAPRPQPLVAPAAERPEQPFAVRIPGAESSQTPAAPTPSVAAPTPSVDFGLKPAVAPPRQEPSFAPAAPPTPAPRPESAAAAPVSNEPAPFRFDFGQPSRQQPEPQPQPAPAPVEAPAAEAPADDDHDTIADLIAAELLGSMAAQSAPVTPAPTLPPAQAEAPEPTPPEPAPRPSWSPTPVTPTPAAQTAAPRVAMRPVNLTPLHKAEKPESDSFRVAPVFGLGTTPPAAAPTPTQAAPVAPVAPPRAEHGYLSPVTREPERAAPVEEPEIEQAIEADSNDDAEVGLDPIDEIESLIGRAVRVELDNTREQQQQRAVPSPALRSLATPTLHQPTPVPHASGVDEAILAAAAATGAQVGWVEHEDDHQTMAPPERRRGRERTARSAGTMRAVAGPVIAVALLLAAGFGLYSVLGLGKSDGPAPVLTADATPTKQVPEAAAPAAQAPQSVVFNEMDGVVPGAEEQLVSRDQADVNEVTRLPTTPSVSEEGLANRKVRTVTVRPDGTIVSGEDSVAGAAILPVDRPNVPAVPGAETASSELLASAAALQPTPSAAPATPVVTAPVTPLVPGTEIAVVDATGAPVAGKTAPVPYVRPASVGDAPATGPVTAIITAPQASLPPAPANSTLPQAPAQPEDLIARLTGTADAPAQPAAAAAATTTTTASTAPAYVQLSSQRSEAVAQQVAADLTARYGTLFNGASLEVNRVDLGAKGIFYRVRMPASSAQAASQLCSSIKTNGGDCFTM